MSIRLPTPAGWKYGRCASDTTPGTIIRAGERFLPQLDRSTTQICRAFSSPLRTSEQIAETRRDLIRKLGEPLSVGEVHDRAKRAKVEGHVVN
jgi:hypothetical protein